MDVRLSRHRTPRFLRPDSLRAQVLMLLAVCAPAVALFPCIARAQSNTVTLSWTAPGDDGTVGTAASYDIRMSVAPIDELNWAAATSVPGAPVPLAAGNRQSLTVNGLSQGVTYWFAIKAVDDAGNVAPISNIVRWDWIIDTAPPAAPSGVAAVVGAGSARVTVSWAANAEPDLAGYTVYRGLAEAGPFEAVALGLTAIQYVDTSLPGGATALWYRVSATDQTGNESARSATAQVNLAGDGGVAVAAATWSLRPAYPNPGPVTAPVSIPVEVPASGGASAYLRIVDAAGHLVRRLDLLGAQGGPMTMTWDGRNYAGRLVAPGVYTAWLIGAGAARSIKIVRRP